MAVSFLKDRRKRKIFIVITSIILAVAVIFGACVIYLTDYYHADINAIEVFSHVNTTEINKLDDGAIAFEPDDATKGLIFYPGGKVEYTAYIPLMEELSSKGVLCVLVKMPFNLAVFDINAADGIQEKYPEIASWYIGGHSLGGSMAASYLSKNIKDFDGLILLGSYSTADISDVDLDVLSIYGSEDMVLNREKYSESKINLPDDFTEVIIDGGCHAYFGMYGAQDGDGTPTISNEEQLRLTTKHIIEMMQ